MVTSQDSKAYYTFEEFKRNLNLPSPLTRLTLRSMIHDGDISKKYLVTCPTCRCDIMVETIDQTTECNNQPYCGEFNANEAFPREVYVPKR